MEREEADLASPDDRPMTALIGAALNVAPAARSPRCEIQFGVLLQGAALAQSGSLDVRGRRMAAILDRALMPWSEADRSVAHGIASGAGARFPTSRKL